MTPLFKKLNLKDQKEIVVLGAPSSFEPELAALTDATGVTVHRSLDVPGDISFALAFVLDQASLEKIVPELTRRAVGDATVWFAYPKLSSKKYTSDLNRDEGWVSLSEAGFRPVRSVAIDEDWSGVRFRRVEYVKSSGRSPKS